MATQRLTRVLCVADPSDAVEDLGRLLEAAPDRGVQAAAVVGNLGRGPARSESYRTLFRALARTELPVYWVPGPGDAPVSEYLREAYNIEVVAPHLHGVHGTAAYSPGGHVVFAGIGGELSDDPDAPRDELLRLHYPRWEAEYRLKLLYELGEHESVLLSWVQPMHKRHGSGSSEALAELINTHRPRLAVCGGQRTVETLGRSLVVAPGSLSAGGQYAVVDLHSRDVQLEELTAAAR